MEAGPLREHAILVVEDDEAACETIQRRLEAVGARVVIATNGLEGLMQLEHGLFDAVLCDLKMPVMDGLEFARRMRQLPQHRHVLLVAVTGWARQPDVVHTWEAGFDAVLIKPVTEEAWASIVRRVAGGSAEKFGFA